MGTTLIFQTPPMETPDRPNDPSGVSKQLATLDNRILKGGVVIPLIIPNVPCSVPQSSQTESLGFMTFAKDS